MFDEAHRDAARDQQPQMRPPPRTVADREVPLDSAPADVWAALQPELRRRRRLRAPAGFERRVMAAIRAARG
jgi:hypothetical protein